MAIDTGTLRFRDGYSRWTPAYGAVIRLSLPLLATVLTALAQMAPAQTTGSTPAGEPHRPEYVLGIDDQLIVQVLDLDEIKGDRPLRVDMQGNIRLPIVGRMHVAGLPSRKPKPSFANAW